jgi:hypothetical protein
MKSFQISALLLAVVFCGCGEAKIPVSGSVQYKDKPLSNVNVIMVRSDGKVASATTDANGAFASVTTDAPGDGALAGKYKVGITPVSTASAQPATAADYALPTKQPFPDKYLGSDSSGLEVTVEPGMAPVQLSLKD